MTDGAEYARTWTDEPPQVPGWYWCAGYWPEPRVVSVEQFEDGDLYVGHGAITVHQVGYDVLWSGPIPEPVEANGETPKWESPARPIPMSGVAGDIVEGARCLQTRIEDLEREVRELREPGPRIDIWRCPDCGFGVAADEDGCCIGCGRDCEPAEAEIILREVRDEQP